MSLDSFSGRAPRPRSDFEIALLDVEVGFTGRSSEEGTDKDIILSYLALAVGSIWFVLQFSSHYSMDLSERVSSSDRLLYSIGTSFFQSFLIWILTLTILKRT